MMGKAAAALAVIMMMAVAAFLAAAGGGGLADAASERGRVIGQTELNTDAVPRWAVKPLTAAARTCKEITAPILAAQIDTESDWNPNAYNAGSQATGLAQFIPSTWDSYGTDGDGDGTADPRNPADAITTQAIYMCHLVKFVTGTDGLTGETSDLALAAYNAGPGNVEKYGAIPPFPETTNYVTTIRRLANTTYATAGGSSTTASGAAGAVIRKAAEHVGKTWYAWGGGTLNGPSEGSAPDVGVTGFDCSSLVRYAYYQGSGQQITLPRTSREQYAATQNQSVAVNALRPGDLMFWGSGSIHHVALYIGQGRMIEAPESGKKIRETAIRTDGDYAGAARVLGGPLD